LTNHENTYIIIKSFPIFVNGNDGGIKAGIYNSSFCIPVIWRDFTMSTRIHLVGSGGKEGFEFESASGRRVELNKVTTRQIKLSNRAKSNIDYQTQVSAVFTKLAAVREKKRQAKFALTNRLGMDSKGARTFIERYGLEIAYAAIAWFDEVPIYIGNQEIRYRDILSVAQQAIDERKFSLLSFEFKVAPSIVVGWERILNAIIFIAKSFAPVIAVPGALVDKGSVSATAAA